MLFFSGPFFLWLGDFQVTLGSQDIEKPVCCITKIVVQNGESSNKRNPFEASKLRLALMVLEFGVETFIFILISTFDTSFQECRTCQCIEYFPYSIFIFLFQS